MKAWRVSGLGVSSIVFADSRGEAKMAFVQSARESGYKSNFSGVYARRAYDFDNATLGHFSPEMRIPYIEKYLSKTPPELRA